MRLFLMFWLFVIIIISVVLYSIDWSKYRWARYIKLRLETTTESLGSTKVIIYMDSGVLSKVIVPYNRSSLIKESPMMFLLGGKKRINITQPNGYPYTFSPDMVGGTVEAVWDDDVKQYIGSNVIGIPKRD